MPEPVVLIIGGVALYSWLKAKNVTSTQQPISGDASGTGPDAPTASVTGTVNNQLAGITIGTAMATEDTGDDTAVIVAAPLPVPSDIALPADLVAALDNDTALAMRAYARLNPTGFQEFLDRYADRMVLRNDLVIEKLTNPPDPVVPTESMLIGMGSAAYRVAQAINGVSAGKSLDIFGLSASVAGALPGIPNEMVSALQGMAMSYRAITSLSQVMTLASANGVSVMNFTAMTAAGAYPGLAALPLAGVLMAVGLVVDIGFTIIGDKPDLQKAIDVALDVASLAVLFIPVIGVVIAIVIQLVKFIIDLFGEQLFGGGMSHEQREMLEAARYGENLNPMYPQLADCYTPRELFRTIVSWGSGYCGGRHVVAMAVALVLKAGDVVPVGGQPYVVPADTMLNLGDNDQAGGCYWLQGTPFARMSNDEQALALGAYASVNGVSARAQVGIAEWRKEQFNDPTEQLIMARAQPMHDFIVKHHLGLDAIDQIAREYRAQPGLTELATSFGWPTWQELFASCVPEEWHAFNMTVANGTLADFARQNGYPTMYAFREAVLSSYQSRINAVKAASAALYQRTIEAQRLQTEALMYQQQQMSMSTP